MPKCLRHKLVWFFGLVALGIAIVAGVVSQTRHVPSEISPSLRLRKIADVLLSGGADRLDYASIDPGRHLLYIAHLGSNAVIAFDLSKRQVLNSIPGVPGATGVLVVPELGKVYASAGAANKVVVIDEHTQHVIATIPTHDFPDGLAYDPPGKKVFVSNESGQALTVIDAVHDAELDTIHMDGDVGNTQYDTANHSMYSNVQSKNQLVRVDPATDRVLNRYDLPGCQAPHGLLINPNGNIAYIACAGNAKLALFDLSLSKVLSVGQSTGDDPDVLAYDQTLQRLYIASESGTLTIFQTRGTTVTKIGSGWAGSRAHTVTVDQTTHQIYLPLENLNGRPYLRILEPLP